MSFQVSLKPSGHQFEIEPDQTLLNAALKAGYTLPYGCRNGGCGACKGMVLSGQIDHGNAHLNVLSETERALGKALFCCATACSDVVLECREVNVGQGIEVRLLPCRVDKKLQLAPDVMVMHLKLPTNERLQFLPGQYIEFILKDGQRRAFSLANAPHDDQMLELHLRLIPGGVFTEHVFKEMPERTILRFEGPMGTFNLKEESDKAIIFVAGGTGFAPIKGMIEHAIHQKMTRPMTLYWGAHALQDLYMQSLPETWAKDNKNITFIPVLSAAKPEDHWTGRTGLVHEAVMADHSDLSTFEVYCCGAPGMVEAAHRDFLAHGLPEDAFFSDAFTFASKSLST